MHFLENSMFVLNAYFCRELRFVAILRSKLSFLLRNTGVDSDFTQNFWGKNWWLGALSRLIIGQIWRRPLTANYKYIQLSHVHGHLNFYINVHILYIILSSNYVQNTLWQSGKDSKWFLKQSFFKIRLWHARPLPSFTANAILNFIF